MKVCLAVVVALARTAAADPCETLYSAAHNWATLALARPQPSATPIALAAALVATAVDDDLTDGRDSCGITQFDSTHFVVPPAVVDALLRRDAAAFRVRPVPAFADGKPSGYKLFSVRPGGLAATLGLRNADLVVTANGIPLAGELDASAALAALAKRPPTIELVVDNHDERRTIFYGVR